MRVPSALTTKFNETLRAVGGFSCPYGHQPECHLSQRQFEDLLDRLKYDLAMALLSQSFTSTTQNISVPTQNNP